MCFYVFLCVFIRLTFVYCLLPRVLVSSFVAEYSRENRLDQLLLAIGSKLVFPFSFTFIRIFFCSCWVIRRNSWKMMFASSVSAILLHIFFFVQPKHPFCQQSSEFFFLSMIAVFLNLIAISSEYKTGLLLLHAHPPLPFVNTKIYSWTENRCLYFILFMHFATFSFAMHAFIDAFVHFRFRLRFYQI